MARDELRPVLQKSHGCDPPSEGTEYGSCPSREPGPRSCAPVTASFKLGLTGRLDYAVARGHGRTPSSSISFSSQCSHPLSIGINPYIFEQSGQKPYIFGKCHRQMCSLSVVGKQNGVTRGLTRGRPTSGEEPLPPKRWSGIREMPMPRHPPTSLDSAVEYAPHNRQDEK